MSSTSEFWNPKNNRNLAKEIENRQKKLEKIRAAVTGIFT